MAVTTITIETDSPLSLEGREGQDALVRARDWLVEAASGTGVPVQQVTIKTADGLAGLVNGALVPEPTFEQFRDVKYKNDVVLLAGDGVTADPSHVDSVYLGADGAYVDMFPHNALTGIDWLNAFVEEVNKTPNMFATFTAAVIDIVNVPTDGDTITFLGETFVYDSSGITNFPEQPWRYFAGANGPARKGSLVNAINSHPNLATLVRAVRYPNSNSPVVIVWLQGPLKPSLNWPVSKPPPSNIVIVEAGSAFTALNWPLDGDTPFDATHGGLMKVRGVAIVAMQQSEPRRLFIQDDGNPQDFLGTIVTLDTWNYLSTPYTLAPVSQPYFRQTIINKQVPPP